MNSWYFLACFLVWVAAYFYQWNKLNKYRHLVDKQHHAYCEILLQRFRDVETIEQLAEKCNQLIEEKNGKEIRLN